MTLGHNVVQELTRRPIDLYPEKSGITIWELRARFPERPLIACDFHVQEIHLGEEVTGGYARDGITNIDHHAPTERMARQISSAHLAMAHVREHGPASAESVVVINHTDCDSVLSSALVRGLLPPDPRFGDAALAADHTGAENEIADLLQTISDLRDLTFSLRNLQCLLEGRPLDAQATCLLQRRQSDRAWLREMVRTGAFQRVGGVAYAVLTEKVDGGLLPSLLPDAAPLMIAAPSRRDPSRWETRVRLGLGTPEGLNLLKLGIEEFDPVLGGRWNAGANARGGWVTIPPEQYAALLNGRLQRS